MTCPDIDRAIDRHDNAPERFAGARCCKCEQPAGDNYRVNHGFVTCERCLSQAAVEYSTYKPLSGTGEP